MRNPLKGSHHLYHKGKALREHKHLSENKMRSIKLLSKIKGKLNLMMMSLSLRPKIKLKKVVMIKCKQLSLHQLSKSRFEFLHEEFNQVKKNLKRRDKKRL